LHPPSLANVLLDGNPLKSLPLSLLCTPPLRHLSLRAATLTSYVFPTLLPDVSHPKIHSPPLTFLDLSHNALGRLPPPVPFLPSLQTLNVSANGLSDLPEDLSNLRRLKTFAAANNKFVIFISHARHLEHLLSICLHIKSIHSTKKL
jgi:Leucine-rich repeat (LRR) protein